MSASATLGRVVVLIILIVFLVAGGILWFDYLGLVNSRDTFAPVYRLFGADTRAGISTLPREPGDLDADRLAKRLESLDLRTQELDKTATDLTRREAEILQMAQEIEDRQVSLEERERTFAALMRQSDDRATNIAQIAAYINGMPPQAAVNNLLAMDDQDIIDILRQVEQQAAAAGRGSSVAFWFSLMPPARAAEIQRKMANKPVTIP